MGLFDRVSGTPRTTESNFSPAEAFAAIMLVAVASDGYLSDEEAQGLSTSLSRMQLFRSYPGDVTRKMFDRLLSILQRQGIKSLLNMALAVLPHDLYETAFAMATDLVLADGEVTQEEEELLNDLHRALEIPEEEAIKIIDVMVIKNRG